MTSERYFYCNYQINLMKSIGIWPLESTFRLGQCLLRAFRYFQMVILFICSLGLLGATLFTTDLKKISSTMDILTLTSSALYKVSFISLHIERVRRLVRSMDFEFIPQIRNKDGVCNFDVKYESRRCTLYSNAFVLSGMVTMMFYSLLPVLEGEKFERIAYENETAAVYRKMKNYPLPFWLPFKSDSNLVYGCVYFIQGCGLVFSATIYLVNDSLFFMIIYQIALQMRALSFILMNLGKRNLDFDEFMRSSSTMRGDDIDTKGVLLEERRKSLTILDINTNNNSSKNSQENKELIECMNFHSRLLRMMVEVEELNRSIILADVIHAIISLSFGLFDTGISDSIYESIIKYMFLVICILHQFLNCYYGEMFLQAQEKISEAIYMSDWTDRNLNYRKYVIMIQLRSKKCTLLNGGKIYKLRRSSFVLFLKSIFSYYMVLRQASE